MLDGGRARRMLIIYGSGDRLAPGGHRRVSNVAILLSAGRVEHGIGACAQSPRGQVWGFFWRAQRSSGGILRSDEDTNRGRVDFQVGASMREHQEVDRTLFVRAARLERRLVARQGYKVSGRIR